MHAGIWRGIEVAIKCMVKQRPREELNTFAKEAAMASRLLHRNVVATYSHDIRTISHPVVGSPEPGVYKLYLIQVRFGNRFFAVSIANKHACCDVYRGYESGTEHTAKQKRFRQKPMCPSRELNLVYGKENKCVHACRNSATEAV